MLINCEFDHVLVPSDNIVITMKNPGQQKFRVSKKIKVRDAFRNKLEGRIKLKYIHDIPVKREERPQEVLLMKEEEPIIIEEDAPKKKRGRPRKKAKKSDEPPKP